jgi:hypothetical protein
VQYIPGVGDRIAKMIDNGNYRGGRYAPGSDVVVLVYDGLVQGDGETEKRVTVVGYAKVRIIGYGVSLDDAMSDPYDKTGDSVYAYAVEPMEECGTIDECEALLERWAPKVGVLVK